MTENYKFKPASEEVLTLYCFVGEAVCAVQHLEDALSHAIALKHNTPSTKSEADERLAQNRKHTLGRAIGILERESLCKEPVLTKLKDFLDERNWLIHKSIAPGREEWDNLESRPLLIDRIKAVTTHAQILLQAIESDLIEFAEANSKDMTRVKEEIRRHYS